MHRSRERAVERGLAAALSTTRTVRTALALGGATLASVFASGPPATGEVVPSPSAAHLAALDPGARIDGNSLVVTGNGEPAFGVPDRPNFIIAVGSNETITGEGVSTDQLGAIGQGDTIRAGAGPETLYGGPHGTLIGGSGPDLLIDTYAGATVMVHGSGDEVVLSGRDDRVICSPGARHDVIYDRGSDVVGQRCRANHDPVRSLSDRRTQEYAPDAHVAAVHGDGSNANPFVAACSDPQNVSCTVDAFPRRDMSGLWSNEYVPAYRCPGDHAFLLNIKFTDFGTTVPKGVQIQEDSGTWPIGVSIAKASVDKLGALTGTKTDFPNSSATLWDPFGSHWYKVVLHCTNKIGLATVQAPSGPFGG